jgi:tRNA-specific 2-thiouridylase
MLLPIGQFEKPTIRRIAESLGLNVAQKKDSQEICFVAAGKHAEFVRSRSGGRNSNGRFVTTSGEVVGTHQGIEGFTVGQRKGLGIAMGEPYFVVRIEPDSQDVVIGPLTDLGRHELTAENTNWLIEPPKGEFRCFAQIRYNSPARPATATVLKGARLRVVFDEPQNGVAPGQAVVCYDQLRVLGGGWIES